MARYDNSQSRTFSHWDQYLTMAFVLLTYRKVCETSRPVSDPSLANCAISE